MSGPVSAFIRRTVSTTSPFTSVVLFQSAELIAREKTTLGIAFILAATSGIAFAAIGVGHHAAIMSYVVRPKSNTPPPLAFPVTNSFHSVSSGGWWAKLMSPRTSQ